MTVATKTTREISELETAGQLLRFKQPLIVEVNAEPGAYGLWMPAFELGSAARDEAEAWEMLAELIISVYLDYRDHPEAKLHRSAVKQRGALFAAASGFYVRQPA